MVRRIISVSMMVAAACIALAPAESAGSPVTIDQANDGFFPQLYQNASYFAPFGQEFTPALDVLDFVDLRGDGGIGVASVRIRAGSIDGPIIGTSDPTRILAGELRFTFRNRVRLVPGNLYVIDVIAGDSGWLVGSTTWNAYADGRQVLWGVPVAGNDLWFREGSVTEPSLVMLMAIGLAWLAKRRPRPRPAARHCRNDFDYVE